MSAASLADEVPVRRYEIVRRLAAGGMAEVFLARTLDASPGDAPIVIKRMLPALRHDPEFVQMFLREGRIATQLTHPNIVRVFEVGESDDGDDGGPFLAMEYLEGADLRTLLKVARARRQTLGVGAAVSIAAQIARGLAHAHELRDKDGAAIGVIHRDVSPHNVFVTHAGVAKLLDFGIAKSLQQRNVTRGGVMRGKLGYMAPEQVRGMPVDARTDLFALGIVLWETLTTERLFYRDNDAAMLYAVANGPRPLPSTRARGIPADLDALVSRLLEAEPAKRPSRALEIAESLEAIAKRLSTEQSERALADRVRAFAPPAPTVSEAPEEATTLLRRPDVTRTASIAGAALYDDDPGSDFASGDALSASATIVYDRGDDGDPTLASATRVRPRGAARDARSIRWIVGAVAAAVLAAVVAVASRAAFSTPPVAMEAGLPVLHAPRTNVPARPLPIRTATAAPAPPAPPPVAQASVADAAPRASPITHTAPASRTSHASRTSATHRAHATPLAHGVSRDYP